MTSRPPTHREFDCEPVNVNGVCPLCGFTAREAKRYWEVCANNPKSGFLVWHEDDQLRYCFAVETKAA